MSTAAGPSLEAIASITALYDDMRTKARPLVDKFEARYTAWKQTRENSSTDGDEFAKLAGMGIKILPLIAYKLYSETEVTDIELYNAVERDANFKSQSATDIIANNHERNKDFAECASRWETHKANTRSNNSQEYTVCGEFMDLIDLGIGIVPHAMLVYYNDVGGWWDELLCELITGHKSGAPVMFRRDIHKSWIDWFENKEGEAEAPYALVGEAATLERWMRGGGVGHPHAELAEENGGGSML